MIHIEVTDEEIREDLDKLFEWASKLAHKYNGNCNFSKQNGRVDLDFRMSMQRAPKR